MSFHADASNNIAAYYGQSPTSGQIPLSQLCSQASIDIIIIGFVVSFIGAGGYPAVNFGGCNSQSTQQVGTQLLYCQELATQIASCRAAGKKILVSIGGATGTAILESSAHAVEIAKVLWDLFGASTDLDQGLRPFGNTTVDGFDIGILVPPTIGLTCTNVYFIR
jgi:chitinase